MKTSFFRVCLVSAAVIGFTLPQAKAQHPVFSEVSVHDPSVIKTGDTYYVFGSHLASAKSKNLMQWQQISSSVNPNNPLIPNVYTELKETFDWASLIRCGRRTSPSCLTGNITCTITPVKETRRDPLSVSP